MYIDYCVELETKFLKDGFHDSRNPSEFFANSDEKTGKKAAILIVDSFSFLRQEQQSGANVVANQ